MYLPKNNRQIKYHKKEYGNKRKRIAAAMLFFTMFLIVVSFFVPCSVIAQDYHSKQAPCQEERIPFRVVSWNIENLFDTHHDSLKNDHEFLPDLSVLSIKQIVYVFCLLTNMFLCMVGGTNKGSTLYDVESFL